LDLKNYPGSFKKGAIESPNATFTIKDEDFVKLMSHEVDP